MLLNVFTPTKLIMNICGKNKENTRTVKLSYQYKKHQGIIMITIKKGIFFAIA
jgi:hypothetical protein